MIGLRARDSFGISGRGLIPYEGPRLRRETRKLVNCFKKLISSIELKTKFGYSTPGIRYPVFPILRTSILNSANSITGHFWVCAYPFVETTLFLVPAFPFDSTTATASSIELYDADGNLSNELQVEFPKGQVAIVELDTIMGGCKLESGLKHASVPTLACTPP